MRRVLVLLLAILSGVLGWAAPITQQWTLVNPGATAYTDEVFRIPFTLQTPFDADALTLTEDGAPVVCQVEVLEGTRAAVTKGAVWAITNLPAHGTHAYELTQPNPADGDAGDAAGPLAPSFPPVVSLSLEDDDYVLDNGLVAVRVPTFSETLRGPIEGVRASEATDWLGASTWNTKLQLVKLTSRVLGDGTLFAKVKLHYEFAPVDGVDAPYADVTVRLAPGQSAVTIEEAHHMAAGDSWTFAAYQGWQPTSGLARGWYRWDTTAKPPTARIDETLRAVPFTPSDRTGNTLLSLQPYWTTNMDAGWYFAATDGTSIVGVAAARGGKWDWPQDNRVAVQINPAVKGALAFNFPTAHGRRYTLLTAGPRAPADASTDMIMQVAVQPLDKLVNDYQLDWPDAPKGDFVALSPFTGAGANPAGAIASASSTLLQKLTYGLTVSGGLDLVGSARTYLDPDFSPGFINHGSPASLMSLDTVLRLPILQSAALKTYPHITELGKQAEGVFQSVVDANITLPSGAGQGSPGQLHRSLQAWLGLPSGGIAIVKGKTFGLVDVARKYLGFDPLTWPRIKAAISFLSHTSAPTGAGARRILPVGDTAYPGLASNPGSATLYGMTPASDDFAALQTMVGAKDDVTRYTSEELPGFGAILRNKAGDKAKESFLAFIAGPNRVGMHGDALSFHFCANATPLAIDQMFGSAFRDVPERQHNRVSFSTPEMPVADMGGYPRLIAFKSTADVDVAIGQVESTRLRKLSDVLGTPAPTPPVYLNLDKPLTYRRTLFLVKNLPHDDVVVVRDQASGPVLTATYNMHHARPANGATCSMTSTTAETFGNMRLLILTPKTFDIQTQIARLDWPNATSTAPTSVMRSEYTEGWRFSQTGANTEFITVLIPETTPATGIGAGLNGNVITISDGAVSQQITLAEPGTDPQAAVISVTRGATQGVLLTAGDIDLNRSQGDVALFTPESEDVLGPIPDWLRNQRTATTVNDSSWDW
jgi:hypothetical protein